MEFCKASAASDLTRLSFAERMKAGFKLVSRLRCPFALKPGHEAATSHQESGRFLTFKTSTMFGLYLKLC